MREDPSEAEMPPVAHERRELQRLQLRRQESGGAAEGLPEGARVRVGEARRHAARTGRGALRAGEAVSSLGARTGGDPRPQYIDT